MALIVIDGVYRSEKWWIFPWLCYAMLVITRWYILSIPHAKILRRLKYQDGSWMMFSPSFPLVSGSHDFLRIFVGVGWIANPSLSENGVPKSIG